MPKARVGDLVMHYQLDDFTDPWRESETVLLYHGYARNAKFWYAWVPALARRYRVLRPDARGCGETSVPAPDYTWTLEQLADDALGLIDHLGIEKIHWVGESSGGIVGLQFAYAHPERTKSLTLVNTPFKIPDRITASYSVGEADPAAALEKMGVKAWCLKTINGRLDTAVAHPGLVEWYATQMAKTPLYVAMALVRLFSGASFWDRLPAVRVPTLMLVGERSPIASPAEQQLMRARMPNAELVVFEGIGHGINLLIPDRCTAALLPFLDRLWGG